MLACLLACWLRPSNALQRGVHRVVTILSLSPPIPCTTDFKKSLSFYLRKPYPSSDAICLRYVQSLAAPLPPAQQRFAYYVRDVGASQATQAELAPTMHVGGEKWGKQGEEGRWEKERGEKKSGVTTVSTLTEVWRSRRRRRRRRRRRFHCTCKIYTAL